MPGNSFSLQNEFNIEKQLEILIKVINRYRKKKEFDSKCLQYFQILTSETVDTLNEEHVLSKIREISNILLNNINKLNSHEIELLCGFKKILEMNNILAKSEKISSRYLSDKKRQLFEVKFENGVPYDLNGRPLEDGKYLYVLLEFSDGPRLFASKETGHHSYLSMGLPVLGTGHFFIKNNLMNQFSNESGHYKLTKNQMIDSGAIEYFVNNTLPHAIHFEEHNIVINDDNEKSLVKTVYIASQLRNDNVNAMVSKEVIYLEGMKIISNIMGVSLINNTTQSEKTIDHYSLDELLRLLTQKKIKERQEALMREKQFTNESQVEEDHKIKYDQNIDDEEEFVPYKAVNVNTQERTPQNEKQYGLSFFAANEPKTNSCQTMANNYGITFSVRNKEQRKENAEDRRVIVLSYKSCSK